MILDIALFPAFVAKPISRSSRGVDRSHWDSFCEQDSSSLLPNSRLYRCLAKSKAGGSIIVKSRISKGICCIIVVIFLVAGFSVAGDVTYTIWEDEAENLWIRIHNGIDHVIRVEEISITFYDAKSRPVEQRIIYCRKDCSLARQDVRDFGLQRKPENAESYKLRNVRYAIER